jgi:hypothetical protein
MPDNFMSMSPNLLLAIFESGECMLTNESL